MIKAIRKSHFHQFPTSNVNYNRIQESVFCKNFAAYDTWDPDDTNETND